MTNTPRPVILYVPLMKELGITWSEIKRMPSWELEGLQGALNEYNVLHSMDGYTDKQVSQIAKDNPDIRSQWSKYQSKKAKYEEKAGIRKEPQDFKSLLK